MVRLDHLSVDFISGLTAATSLARLNHNLASLEIFFLMTTVLLKIQNLAP